MREIQLGSFVMAIGAASLSATVCHAQIAGRGALTQSETSAPSAFVQTGGGLPPVFQNGTITPTHYSTTLTGDASVILPPPSNFGPPITTATSFTGIDAFSVGPLPVEISHLRLAANFKLVNSGGSTSVPAESYVGCSVAIRQFTSPLVVQPNIDPLVGALVAIRPVLTGNGFVIDSFTQDSLLAPYVLSAGQSYYFQIYVQVTETTPTPFNAPQYGYTLEFGGPLSAGSYSGFTASFDYRTVPTTSTTTACLALATMFGRRRRR